LEDKHKNILLYGDSGTLSGVAISLVQRCAFFFSRHMNETEGKQYKTIRFSSCKLPFICHFANQAPFPLPLQPLYSFKNHAKHDKKV